MRTSAMAQPAAVFGAYEIPVARAVVDLVARLQCVGERLENHQPLSHWWPPFRVGARLFDGGDRILP
jgi:hypothetical protein